MSTKMLGVIAVSIAILALVSRLDIYVDAEQGTICPTGELSTWLRIDRLCGESPHIALTPKEQTQFTAIVTTVVRSILALFFLLGLLLLYSVLLHGKRWRDSKFTQRT